MKTDATVPDSKQNRKAAADAANRTGSFTRTEFGRQPVSRVPRIFLVIGSSLMNCFRYLTRRLGKPKAE